PAQIEKITQPAKDVFLLISGSNGNKADVVAVEKGMSVQIANLKKEHLSFIAEKLDTGRPKLIKKIVEPLTGTPFAKKHPWLAGIFHGLITPITMPIYLISEIPGFFRFLFHRSAK